MCFRDLKENVDAAVKLFSKDDNKEEFEPIIRPPFKEVRKELNEKMIAFLEKYPSPAYIDALQSEYDKRDFVLAFRDIIKKRIEIQIYEDYSPDDA